MKANYLKNWNDMVYTDLEKPVAGPGEAVIRMRYAGVCGSDITVYTGSHPTATAPVVIGHEILGTVESVGAGCDLKIGTRVTVDPLISCGVCEACKKGHRHVCRGLKLLGIHENGGYAQYTKAAAEKIVPVPDSLSDTLAALAEPFAVGTHVTARAGIQPGHQVLVIGAGPIGNVVALCAKFRGAEVWVSEISESRRSLAEKLGLNTIDAGNNAKARMEEITKGNGFDAVIEASGSRAGILLQYN